MIHFVISILPPVMDKESKMFRRLSRLFSAFADPSYGMAEFAQMKRAVSEIEKGASEGAGRPVLVLPGFVTGDVVTEPLRHVLLRKGYKAYGWENGLNLGMSEKTVEHLRQHLHKIYEENGGQKVALVGHSLGGVYARELAREFPEMVHCVVTLGTPVRALEDGSQTPEHLKKVYALLNPRTAHMMEDAEMWERAVTPPPVPTTAVFSKSDVVVDWRGALNPDAPQAENVEISSSHLGIVWNMASVIVVLDRLAQDPAQWKPFTPTKEHQHLFKDTLKPEDKPKNPQWHESKSQKPPIFKKKSGP